MKYSPAGREGTMELTGKREVLAEAFSTAQAIATARSTRPVLQNLLIDATKNGTVITATDMEIGLKWRVSIEDCEVKKEGKALVSAARIAQIARIVETNEIGIFSKESSCVIKAGRSVFDVVTENIEDFPEVGDAPSKAALEVEAETFVGMTRRTVFAAAREATRYSLNGVHVEAKDGHMEMVATDGRRLAMVREKVGKDVKLAAAIVPQKALAFVERLKGAGEEKISLAVADRQIFFTGSKGTLVSRLVEGHFPPYNEVIPRDTNRKAAIGREVFMRALKQSLLMTSEESKSALLSFTAGELTITSRAPDEGSSEIKIDVKYEGQPIEIRFNPQFVADALGVSDAEEITVEMKEPSTPAVIKDGTGFLYVVMPIYIV
jgi:DNA polymerase-3 subunit beta